MTGRFNLRMDRGTLLAQVDRFCDAIRELRWQRRSGMADTVSVASVGLQPSFDYHGMRKRGGCRWPQAKEADFVVDYLARVPLKEMSNKYGSPFTAMLARARRLGLTKYREDDATCEKHSGLWTNREDELINYLYDEGKTVEQIAEVLPRHTRAIYARLGQTATSLSSRSRFGKFIKRGRNAIRPPQELER
jgi:hypothetical protein